MEVFVVALCSYLKAVQAFTLPDFHVESSVDTSDNSVNNSIANSSISSFEFSGTGTPSVKVNRLSQKVESRYGKNQGRVVQV